MFVAGIIAGGIIAVAAYDDHSRYSRYSQYGDASLVTEIKSKEAKLRAQERELDLIRHEALEKSREGLAVLSNEENLKLVIEKLGKSEEYLSTAPKKFQREVVEALEGKIKKDLEADKQELADIDKALNKINKLQLECK